jgi:hypothetical protein
VRRILRPTDDDQLRFGSDLGNKVKQFGCGRSAAAAVSPCFRANHRAQTIHGLIRLRYRVPKILGGGHGRGLRNFLEGEISRSRKALGFHAIHRREARNVRMIPAGVDA